MLFTPFELKLADLPKVLEIEMNTGASPSDFAEMVESIRTQVIYNSRDDDRPITVPNVEILERHGDIVKLRVATG